jgi:glyoxylase-like metal-dependent hydrolase (beta-lactamase superfamily II)
VATGIHRSMDAGGKTIWSARRKETTMSNAKPQESGLTYRTYITIRESLSRDAPAGMDHLKWVPNTATLVYGRTDAVLVDTFLTIEASTKLADWIASSGKDLTTIYITHAHGDHFFGLKPVLARFPKARVIARPEVVEAMPNQLLPERLDGFWKRLFPGQIADEIPIAEAMAGDSFELEGHRLVAIGTGHTDTDKTTCLHVPSIGLVVAGDAVYNGVHPFLGETDAKGRREWIAALDLIEQLKPVSVVAGHKAPGTNDDPRSVRETRDYISDFDRLASATRDARELYDSMLDLYPDRLNPGSLWTSARFAKTGAAR